MEPVYVQVKESFATKNINLRFRDPGILIGNRFYTHLDGPIPLDPVKAKEYVDQGFVDIVARMPGKGEKALAPKGEARAAR